MFVGDNDGLGAFIVDGSGRIVARARGVRMLAPGYSLRHGVSGKSYVPAKAAAQYKKFMAMHHGVTGWEAYGSHAAYSPGGVGQLPMNVLAQRAMASSSGRLSGDGMFGWKYGPQAAYTPGMGQLPMNVLARKAMASSSGTVGDMFGWKYGSHAAYTPMGQLPMNVLAQKAMASSSGMAGDEGGDETMADMFGPEGEASALF